MMPQPGCQIGKVLGPGVCLGVIFSNMNVNVYIYIYMYICGTSMDLFF